MCFGRPRYTAKAVRREMSSFSAKCRLYGGDDRTLGRQVCRAAEAGDEAFIRSVFSHTLLPMYDHVIPHLDILLKAFEKGNVECVRIILEYVVFADLTSDDVGPILLKCAARAGLHHCIVDLIALGVDVTYDDNTAIKWAMQENNFKCVLTLLNAAEAQKETSKADQAQADGCEQSATKRETIA